MILQVERAATFVAQGTKHIGDAIDDQKKKRKRMMWCCIVLTVILIIVRAVVGAVVARNIRAAQAATQGVIGGRRLLGLTVLP
jgi:t-SNARE complex subunit (syntaxin)